MSILYAFLNRTTDCAIKFGTEIGRLDFWEEDTYRLI